MCSRHVSLRKLLELLRTPATPRVLVWDRTVPSLPILWEEEPGADHLTSANLLMKAKCAETAALFIYLPRPPDSGHRRHGQYLSSLAALTEGLPPTLMIHGVSPVMTTTF